MELIVFDLDGTLLNADSKISDYTRDTLLMLQRRGIAYTVATGRTLHAARQPLAGHDFPLPQVYKNGVMIWHPSDEAYSHKYLLTTEEVSEVLAAFEDQRITPFIFTLEAGNKHGVYHPPILSEAAVRLADELSINRGLPVLPVSDMPEDVDITNVSALGPLQEINRVASLVETREHLVAYMGHGIKSDDVYWLDIHHSDGTKGSAVALLKEHLGVTRLVCFGDSDNDLSMFELADEAYAPENSKAEVKAAATAVIGHHDEDGIARFLRERFSL
jgi:5-amino-6-(5-phospho-D-ribitylamino)uracil phosphatase